MKPNLRSFCVAGLGLAAALTLTGCINLKPVEDPTRYFVLSDLASASEVKGEDTDLAVGIRPVRIPSYLENNWLAVRQGATEVAYLDTTQWAEDLDRGILRVTGINLGLLLGSEKVRLRDWNREEVDYEIQMAINRFESDEQGLVWLEVTWRISKPSGGALLARGAQRFQKQGPPPEQQPGESVAAMGATLGEFCQVLAAKLKELGKPAP